MGWRGNFPLFQLSQPLLTKSKTLGGLENAASSFIPDTHTQSMMRTWVRRLVTPLGSVQKMSMHGLKHQMVLPAHAAMLASRAQSKMWHCFCS